MKVNIVILTKNRPRLFEQAIVTLRRNTPQELYNLTIVDDDGDFNSVPLGEVYCGNNATCLRITQSKGITGMARNLGVYWAEKYWGRGDYLYLSDNDIFVTPGWLESLIYAMERPIGNMRLIGGWNHPYLQPQDTFTFGNGMCVKSHDAVAGASQLMSWETWDKYSPLDAHAVGVCQGEDWQFCQNIIKDGGRVGSIYPRVVFNCGLTNSHGQPSVGSDVVLKELQEAKRTYSELYWE